MGDGLDAPACIRADADALNGRRAVRGIVGDERPLQRYLDRPFRCAGAKRRQHGVAAQKQLPAETAADIRRHDPHILLVQVKRFGKLVAAPVNHLVGGPDGEFLAFPGGHGRMQFHSHMALIGRGVGGIKLHR